ncbi:Alpha/Beta hydrolase protein [Radiomyces spectabilis]|uniref:Alpha/Beta hydrolase protein n=1 Tax=Radiomyces spectabilis TaxID=64574 RepID=UPI00221E6F47|nr:Alpha/Beta hydrolase protein [Radiomyces spectabilis]KAI8388567.1 Alpha/Beta hydrolase protein [Radiomyces spectabilis]
MNRRDPQRLICPHHPLDDPLPSPVSFSSPPLLPVTRVQTSRSTPLPRKKNKRYKDVYQHSDSILPHVYESHPTSPIHLPCQTNDAHPIPFLKTLPIRNKRCNATSPQRTTRVDILQEPRLHQTFQYIGHPHGRIKSHRVGFAEYGALDDGHPAIVIGGHGCSRLVGVMFEEVAQRYGIRMIWPERPGYGLSEECNPQDLSALEWADVVIQLADHLRIRRFSLIAQSVGTVFALAIALKCPSRVLGPIYLISPWVSTQAANTFKWTRRLPASLVTRTISLAMDVMWMFNKGMSKESLPSRQNPNRISDEDSVSDSSTRTSDTSRGSKKSPLGSPDSSIHSTLTAFEEDELLASLEDDNLELSTDFPPHRPLRHVVRPKHVSLYLAMNRLRMSEPYSQGQLGDVLVALEKYHSFGFSYSEITTSVSAVWGEKDGLIPQKAIDILANSLRDVRLKILDGESHDLVWKEGVMEWTMRGIAERWRGKVHKGERPVVHH